MRRLVLLLLPLLVVVTACQARATVGVDVRPDGSGTVTVTVQLDQEATTRLGDPAAALSATDLNDAGWTVSPPVTRRGAVTLRAVRPFGSPDELAAVLAEVGGRNGLFRSTSLSVGRSFASTTYDFRTTVRLAGSLDQLSDAELAAVLGNLPLGRTAEELAAEGATDKDAAQLSLVVELPGAEPTTWTRSASSGSPTTLVAAASSRVWTWWAVVVAGLGVVLMVAGLVVGLRSRRRPASPNSVPPASPSSVPPASPSASPNS
ncbi:MAG: hypothetical protein ACKO04_05170 [Actinomycetes bacterium]